MIIDQNTVKYLIESMEDRKNTLLNYSQDLSRNELEIKTRINELNRAIEYFNNFLLD